MLLFASALVDNLGVRFYLLVIDNLGVFFFLVDNSQIGRSCFSLIIHNLAVGGTLP